MTTLPVLNVSQKSLRSAFLQFNVTFLGVSVKNSQQDPEDSQRILTGGSPALQCVLISVVSYRVRTAVFRTDVLSSQMSSLVGSDRRIQADIPPSLLELSGFRSRLRVSSEVYFRFHERLSPNPGGGERGQPRVRMSHFLCPLKVVLESGSFY